MKGTFSWEHVRVRKTRCHCSHGSWKGHETVALLRCHSHKKDDARLMSFGCPGWHHDSLKSDADNDRIVRNTLRTEG